MKSNIINITMRNGLVLGVLFSLNFFFSVSGIVMLALLTYVALGFIIYLTYKYTKHYRDNDCNGFISFRRAFGFVMLLYFFATIISSFVKYFFLLFSNSSLLDDIYNRNILAIEQMEQVFPALVEDMHRAIEVLTTPLGYTMMVACTNIIIYAVVMGLIIALIVKRKASPFDNN